MCVFLGLSVDRTDGRLSGPRAGHSTIEEFAVVIAWASADPACWQGLQAGSWASAGRFTEEKHLDRLEATPAAAAETGLIPETDNLTEKRERR